MREAELAITQKPNLATAYLLKSQTLMAIEREASVESGNVVRVQAKELTKEEREERRQRYRKSVESFAAAADALQTYLKLAASDKETAFWQEQLETLRAFSGSKQGTEPDFVSGSEVTTKVRVLRKPDPAYTEQARRAQIAGTVILRAVFTSKGTVEHILVLRSLPAGLTEEAVRAARQIKFTPATKNGNPVSMIMELQYNFNLY